MRILLVHNRYQVRGGEDVVADQEAALLRLSGFAVETLFIDNDGITGPLARIGAALGTVHNPFGVRKVARAIARFKPDVMHVHNFSPRFSPAVFAAARKRGVATVLTLHNFRTQCAGALLLREGRPCETCLTASPFHGAWHRCFRGSLAGSTALAAMIAWHRRRGTWTRDVDRFIALSDFALSRFALAGMPVEKFRVKPNFALDPGPPGAQERSGFLYVGRLSEEKGVHVLLEAARKTDAVIRVAGDGPLMERMVADAPPNLHLLGRKSREEVQALMAQAQALLLPSITYEGFPMTLAEAYAAGTPVIGSKLGSLGELIEDGVTGLHAPPGDAAALAQVLDAARLMPQALAQWGRNARRRYEAQFTPEASVAALRGIYEEALASRRAEPI